MRHRITSASPKENIILECLPAKLISSLGMKREFMTHGSFQYGRKWITPLFLRYKVLCPRVTPTLLRSTFL
jgi:hypothetical protein